MNRTWAGLLLLLLPWGLVAEAAEPSVYVDSVPLGARIVLDGRLTESRTPALLRGLPAGPHQVALWKSGFVQVTQSFAVVAGKVPAIRVNLPPESVVLAFPSNDQIVSGNESVATAGRQFRFPAGAYFLSGSDDAVRMTPVFEDSSLLDTSGWMLTLTGAAALASGTRDGLRWRAGEIDRPTALTIGLGSAALGELAWQISLQTRKARYYQETAPAIGPQPERLDQASALFRDGDQALQGGDLAAAEALFKQVIRSHPDSQWVPGSWFRLAKVHSVTGRRDLALGEYRLVANTFPQPEFHDRARQALADLNEAAGNLQEALDQVDLMVLTDGFFDKDTVAAQRQRLAQALEATPAPVPDEPTEAADAGPRRGYERTLGLFAQGHEFTAEEIAKFPALQDALTERDDGDLAADLDLVRMATGAGSAAAETSAGEEWTRVSAAQRDQQNWRGLRDMGLALFRVSAALAIGTSVAYDRAPSEPVLWALGGALGTMGFSLFPMLWAEPRQ